MAVERILGEAVSEMIALRASIVIGARSRSFRFMVRLIERMPVLALPPWRAYRTRPIDARDLTEILAAWTTHRAPPRRPLNVGGPDVLTYQQMMERIAELMLLDRPVLALGAGGGQLGARLAAAMGGEDPELVTALMESLAGDLLRRGRRRRRARARAPAQLRRCRRARAGRVGAPRAAGGALTDLPPPAHGAARPPRRPPTRRPPTASPAHQIPLAAANGRVTNLMSTITASIEIAAAPEEVWDTVMDPAHLEDWVTIHRTLLRADAGPPRVGFEMDQQLHMRGVSIEVHWKLVECRPCELAVWEGRGPAHSRARTEYRLHAEDDKTRFDYRNEFHPPLGAFGAIISRALVGGMPEREARHTLARLRDYVESMSPTAS